MCQRDQHSRRMMSRMIRSGIGDSLQQLLHRITAVLNIYGIKTIFVNDLFSIDRPYLRHHIDKPLINYLRLLLIRKDDCKG